MVIARALDTGPWEWSPPPPQLFGRKLKTKGDLHVTVGNTEFIKAYGLLAIPLSILTNMLLGLIF